MVNAGRILIVPKGVWSSLTSYEMLDLVTQDGVAYIARQANVGVQPKTDSQYTYWQPFGNASEPDNETIIYTENNRYTVNLDGKTLVYDSNDGITVAIDGETIKFDEDEGYLYADVKSNLADLLDVVLTTPANGQVLTYNAVTGKWVNANPTGGMQAHLVITSEAGSTVTVTTPSGSVITATQVSGSTTQWECDTQEYGVHTIDAVLAGDDAQITVTVDTCKVYNIDDSHVHASITVTFPRGFTCRCQGQGENYYANSNPYTFSVHHLGEYTITATDGADTTYTETVTISSSAQSVNMFCPSVENAPTDDIQLWLMFGGILDKSYTTLSEVLSDSTTLSTLIADNNAVDYLVRSKSWASNKGLVPILSSTTGTNGVVNECGQTFNSTYPSWKAFDGNSSSFGALNSASNIAYIGYTFTDPTKIALIECDMRGLGTIKYTVKLSAEYSDDGTTWNNCSDEYSITGAISSTTKIAITETSPHRYWRVKRNSPTENISTVCYELQFYDYTGNGITEDSTAMTYIGLNNYCANTLLADSDWLNAICNSAYFESVLNAKVPIMTDNTHPSGVCSATSYASGNEPYKAFDGNDSTFWYAGTTQGLLQGIKCVIYDFGSNVKIYACHAHLTSYSDTNRTDTVKVLGSTTSTESDYVTLKEESLTVNGIASGDEIGTFKYLLSNVGNYRYYAYGGISQASTTPPFERIQTLQFYGRQDV